MGPEYGHKIRQSLYKLTTCPIQYNPGNPTWLGPSKAVLAHTRARCEDEKRSIRKLQADEQFWWLRFQRFRVEGCGVLGLRISAFSLTSYKSFSDGSRKL